MPLVAVCLLVCHGVASAQSPRATAIDLDALRPWQGRPVTTLEIEGLPEDLVAAVRGGLALTPRRKLLRVKQTRLSVDVAEADARRVLLLLARHGHPAAEISARAEADGDEGVTVTLVVEPGPTVRYGEVDVRGLPPGAAAAADSVRVRLPRGERFADAAVAAARERLLLAQRRAGHAFPDVDVEVRRPGRDTAAITFACRPGRSFVYRDLRIEGAPDDLTPLVERTVDLEPGTPYTPGVVARARRHLRKLQLFSQVRLVNEPRDSTDLDLVVELKPRRMITLETSIGSFTDDWLVAKAGVTHRNLFGGGRGGAVELTWGQYRQQAEARTWWPGLVSPHSRTDLELRGAIEDEDSYRLEKAEADLSTLFETWWSSSLRVGVMVSDGTLENRSADPDVFASEVGLLTAVSGIWYRDSTDDPIDPSHGSRLDLRSEWSPPGAWTDTPFAITQMSASRYWPLGGRRTLAVRVDGGLGWPLGDAVDLRPDRRFFAGGVSTMRGFRRHDLGPRDSEGNAIGGEARLLAGAEVRLPLAGIFGLAVFVDSGQVWRDRRDLDPSDLTFAAGAGLLVYTPIGPLRLDLARNLSGLGADQSRTLLHFGIGHPY
jgi:outer membrane protein assembly factor BamA